MEKEIKLVLNKVRIYGHAMLKDWYGNIGFIDMKPFDIKLDKIDDEEYIISKLNDNGYGCQEILGACIDKCLVYNEEDLLGSDYIKFYENTCVGKWDQELFMAFVGEEVDF